MSVMFSRFLIILSLSVCYVSGGRTVVVSPARFSFHVSQQLCLLIICEEAQLRGIYLLRLAAYAFSAFPLLAALRQLSSTFHSLCVAANNFLDESVQ
uniref:Secreted protein n=1 Tax=Steinernema glaseri TaxID=37863 RepID=A0A1I7ZEP5_9BILA